MRIAITLLALAGVTFTLPAFADEPASPSAPKVAAPAVAPAQAQAPGVGGPVAPTNANGLSRLHGGLTADGARAAGRSREVEMAADANGPAGKPVRPAPSPRVLRRLGSERVVASIGPAIAACASESRSNAPTAFGVRVSIGPEGEVESTEVASPVRPPPALVACVVKAVSASRFGSPGAAGASIVVPITVPARTASTATMPDATTTTTSVIATAPASAPLATGPKPDDAAR